MGVSDDEKPSVIEAAPTQIDSGVLTDSPGVLVFPPAFFLGTLLLGLLLHLLWPAQLSTTPWVRIAEVGVMVAGILLAAWGRRTMVHAGTNVPPNKPTLAIVTSGPFRFTRNPLYLGATSVYVGLTLIFNAVWPFLLFVPMLLVIHWGVVRREERYLEAKFGDAYLDYKARVRRWL